MSDLKLTPSLLAMLERIEQHSGALLMLAVTATVPVGWTASGENKLKLVAG